MPLSRDEHEMLKQDFEREMRKRDELPCEHACTVSIADGEFLLKCNHCGARKSAISGKWVIRFPKEAPLSTAPGYEPLQRTLQHALDQAQYGKGKERHATGATPFLQQPICEIGRMVGIGYNLGQAMKKSQEAVRLPTERAQAELLGAINYLAAAYLLLEEQDQGAEKTPASAI